MMPLLQAGWIAVYLSAGRAAEEPAQSNQRTEEPTRSNERTKVMKRAFMTIATPALIAAALSVPALAKDVNNAAVVGLESGGLQGSDGCLYVRVHNPADPGVVELYTLPLDAGPNTPQLVAAGILTTHPTVSFNVGAPDPAECKDPDFAKSPTILQPSSP
jgi:hypothetical protein